MAENNPDSRWETRFEDAGEIRLEDVAYREAAYVHSDGKKYLATEFPFEAKYGDYSALEKTVRLNTSKDYPLALVAATVARIANTRMDETKNDGKAKAPHSPTYPVKDGDLVWFAYCELDSEGNEKWKECKKPFEIKIGGQGAFDTSIRAVPQGGYSEDYREMGQILNGHIGREIKVRIYRHADLSQEYLEKTIEPVVERTAENAERSPAAKKDITRIFVDERQNPIQLDE
ncbi:hypothetical protein JW707_01240 [Candidatus Woesearchaeota archaeon]|nr:hypothetical protein [Candidatus Woesearchaeota archaeon]